MNISRVKSILDLKKEIVYGPVQSRRLGRSLGINVLSGQKKICSLNCLYCQYGYTKLQEREILNPTNYISAGVVIEAVKEVLLHQDRPPDYITFSGNGEATLHPDFPALVEAVIRLRDLYAPSSKTAVLSNGTHIGQKPVQDAMSRLDLKVIKLDCAEAGLFKHYNRPVIPFDLDTMVSTLRSMSDLTIQSLFTGGARGNYYSDHLDIWIKTIVLINPVLVQIYSLDRGYLSAQITPLNRTELQPLADRLKQEDIQARVF